MADLSAWEFLSAIRLTSPLVHCITNFVAMDMTANVLLASGASPAMVHAPQEVAEFTSICSALCINIGTLSEDWVHAMKIAAKTANEHGKPWVLDPVGAGATTYRIETSLELLSLKPSVLRGNASEILALSGATSDSNRGVDSTHQSIDALSAAIDLAKKFGCVVAVSGATDFVTDGETTLACSNGVPLLTRITATGCSVTALIGAFLAVDKQRPIEAAAFALSTFNVAAELAFRGEGSKGPGSLRVHLIDALHKLTKEDLSSLIKVNIQKVV